MSTQKLFHCTSKSIPYSLVCDFKHDCADFQDEDFCEYISQDCDVSKVRLEQVHLIPLTEQYTICYVFYPIEGH